MGLAIGLEERGVGPTVCLKERGVGPTVGLDERGVGPTVGLEERGLATGLWSCLPTFAHTKILIKALPTRFRREEGQHGGA